MKIGIAGPMSLSLIDHSIDLDKLPVGYNFPLISWIINGLLNRGHEVVAFTTSQNIDTPMVLEDSNITICIGRREPHAGSDFFSSERADLVNLMMSHPVDILHAHWTYEFAWAALKTPYPVLVTVHDKASVIFKFQPDPYRLVRWIMNNVTLAKAKYLSSVSPYISDNLNKFKTRTISNFFDQNLLSGSFEYTTKEPRIVTVTTSFDRRKNIKNAILAYSLVRKVYPSIKFNLIGVDMQIDGPAYRFARENGVIDGIIFEGYLPYVEVINRIRTSTILLHPSREESFGMVPLEAMVLGTVVIGGRKSGNMPYLLENGNFGILCEINEPKSIADSILNVLEDRDKAYDLSIRAKEHAQRSYSNTIFFNKTLDYYNYIVKNESR